MSVGQITADGVITKDPVTDGTPSLLTPGDDGSADFLITKADGSIAIGQLGADGSSGETALPSGFADILGLVEGPDGNLWFLNDNSWTMAGLGSGQDPQIVRVTPSGELTTFAFPASTNTDPNSGERPPGALIAAPDGHLYFRDNGAIGQVAMDGTVSETDVPAEFMGGGDTIGPDGNLWFAGGDNQALTVGLARFTLPDADEGGGTSAPPTDPVDVPSPPPSPPILMPESPPPTIATRVGSFPVIIPTLDPVVSTDRASSPRSTSPSTTVPSAPAADFFIPLEIAETLDSVGPEIEVPSPGPSVNGHKPGRSPIATLLDAQERSNY